MRVAPGTKLTPLFLDFETFWSDEFTLRKIPTGDYVRDDRFKVWCVAAKLGGAKTRVFTDMDKFQAWLDKLDWNNIVLVGHNLYFDGLILTEIFDVVPAAYHCTMSMSRGLWRNTCPHNLDSLAKRVGLKGKEKKQALVNTKNKDVLSKDELAFLCEYCIDDVEDTAAAYYIMLEYMPEAEMEIISHTVRCFTEPLLCINADLLDEAIEEVMTRRDELLDKVEEFVMKICPDVESLGKALRSRTHFPRMLEELGIDPPMKVSPRTGKPTYALAAKDPEYLALLEDDDPMVVALCEARSEFTSNQTMTRAQRLLSATQGGATLPVMYLYCGAHTMRWSASGKMNLQNLQRGSKLRQAIEAPDGYQLMVGDSGQIEARMVAWIAFEKELVEAFRRGEDVYCLFASEAFGRTITKADELERFVGKTCILGLGYGMGWKKLLTTLFLAGVVLTADQVQRIHTIYRAKYTKIVEFWRKMDQVLAAMAAGGSGEIELAGGELVLEYEPDKIWMPNGLALHYPGLRPVYDEEGRHSGYEFLYVKGQRADGTPVAFWKKIYGGLLTENLTQCLARIVVGEQMTHIARKRRVVMTTHDEIVMLVVDTKKDIEQSYDFMMKEMSCAPDWCASLPVTAEVKNAYHYCK